MFVVALMVVYLRLPLLFHEPRFWAEEGSLYFAHAYSHPWWLASTQVQMGYFALWPNIATTIAAQVVSIQTAPLVTTVFALLVQLLPVGMVIWSRSDLWRGFFVKMFGVALILFIPHSQEVWLNTINSQFFFSLVTFLILLEDLDATRLRRWGYRILLVLAGLTGWVSCFLTPLFVLRYYLEKKPEGLTQAVLLSLCTVLHTVVLGKAMSEGVLGRELEFDVTTLVLVVWIKSIALVYLSAKGALLSAQVFLYLEKFSEVFVGLLIPLMGMTNVAFFYWISRDIRLLQRVMMLGSYLLLITLSTIGALAHDSTLILPFAGPRYSYVPNVIMSMMLLMSVAERLRTTAEVGRDARLRLLLVLLSMSLVFGVRSYAISFREADHLPRWRDEIAIWRTLPDHNPRIWPDGWEVPLSP
ncbi:MAG: hypothetical protein AB7G75_21790 [Candidatus Binatia bacterium]